MNRCLLILSLLTFSQASWCDRKLELWVMALYSPTIVHNMVRPFANHLESSITQPIEVIASSNYQKLFASCKKGLPQIAVLSSKLGERLKVHCSYRVIAEAYSTVSVYSRKQSNLKSISEIKRLGLISGMDTQKPAYLDMFLTSGNVELIQYKNLFELIDKSGQDQIDGVILPSIVINAAPVLKGKWLPIYTYNEKGKALVLVSPMVSDEQRFSVQNIFLETSGISKSVWQDVIGLEPFSKSMSSSKP